MNEIALKEKFPDVDPGLYEYLSDGGDSDDEAADDGDFDGVQLNESFGNAIVVDNIPKVGTEKLEKPANCEGYLHHSFAQRLAVI